ncbi:MAG: hypothetical protein JKY54_15675, partial [Flavobacteriales bacterium]|nr:hypothetical protein [Flavobacteriales bacterium]
MKTKLNVLFVIGIIMYAVSYLVPSFLSGMNHDSLMLGYECFGISIGGLVRGHLFQRSVP